MGEAEIENASPLKGMPCRNRFWQQRGDCDGRLRRNQPVVVLVDGFVYIFFLANEGLE
jgi:hypothetical protein